MRVSWKTWRKESQKLLWFGYHVVKKKEKGINAKKVKQIIYFNFQGLSAFCIFVFGAI